MREDLVHYEYLEIDIFQKSKEFSIGALGCSTENENEATVAPQHDFSLSFHHTKYAFDTPSGPWIVSPRSVVISLNAISTLSYPCDLLKRRQWSPIRLS